MAGLLVLLSSSMVHAEDIYFSGTADLPPIGANPGYWGFDTSAMQSVAVRFKADKDYTLDQLSVWFMNNNTPFEPVVLTLNKDHTTIAGKSRPGEKADDILETWTFMSSAIGWEPEMEVLPSVAHPVLKKNHYYWIVASSLAAPKWNAVWNATYESSGILGIKVDEQWQVSDCNGAVGSLKVEGTPLHGRP